MDENVVNGLGITTTQVISIFELFNNKRLFVIPNYQRNYAWEHDEIADFISDLSECLRVKNEGSTLKHFFGSLLTIKKNDSRVGLENKYELIDGQQRVTTFYIAIAALINLMKAIVLKIDDDEETKEFLNDTIKDIEGDILYVKVRDAISDTNFSKIRRVKFIDRNIELFNKLLDNNTPVKALESAHLNFENAYTMINDFYIEYTLADTLKGRISRINQIVEVLLRDFMILNIESVNKRNAYTFFKVLNDRGKNLSYVDLIKADTMEYFKGEETELKKLESSWDYLMKISNPILERHFNTLYSYYIGKKLPNLKEYELFKKNIFNNFTTLDNKELLEIIEKLVSDIKILETLIDGEIEIDNFANKSYYKQRLNLLINKLKNTSSLPLLIAVVKLNNRKAFISYLEVIEKFFFRYKVICSGHAAAMTNIFDACAKQLYDGKNNETVLSELKTKLKIIQDEKANDSIFEAQIKDKLNYVKCDKKIIKYYLLYLNYYYVSYKNKENPLRLLDSILIVDFDSLTIEHIYNKNTIDSLKDNELEKAKNNIMNLTLLPPLENSDDSRAQTNDFLQKKEVYRQSAFEITKDIANIPDLSLDALNKRLDELISLSKEVFKI